ncbi:phosphate ABC transporter permease PstA [Zhaonella formicivorans]|jgi:phosphate transport system permease protein|uniref:phosphate ABC transporter permease PstA n=1 Tax=Zhaonella formicivorans TaxID=2528593 RepID=UPI0010E44F68|nr:phosphate ABC transporter permease PstA [Zhaonella formicivorans]
MISPKLAEKIAKTLLWVAAIFTVLALILIIGYVFYKGVGKLNLEFLLDSPKRMGRKGGIFPTIVGTIYFIVVTLAIATPIGVGAAIYLNEYTRDNAVTRLIRFGTEALAGVPSIVFGLFGYAFFAVLLKPFTGGWSILSGSLTAATMILPTLIRTSEEALKTVPRSYREGSLALGATKWQTITRVILPSAIPGIITGVILGVGRAIGETAALLLTLGGSLRLPTTIFDPARTLSMHLYLVAMEVGAFDMAFGTAAILIMIILGINFTATWLMNRFIAKLS